MVGRGSLNSKWGRGVFEPRAEIGSPSSFAFELHLPIHDIINGIRTYFYYFGYAKLLNTEVPFPSVSRNLVWRNWILKSWKQDERDDAATIRQGAHSKEQTNLKILDMYKSKEHSMACTKWETHEDKIRKVFLDNAIPASKV